MRPSEIVLMIAGVLVGVAALVLGIFQFVNRDGGEPWFYWISPLLSIGFAGVAFNLVVQYWMKVGRLETRGRPRK